METREEEGMDRYSTGPMIENDPIWAAVIAVQWIKESCQSKERRGRREAVECG